MYYNYISPRASAAPSPRPVGAPPPPPRGHPPPRGANYNNNNNNNNTTTTTTTTTTITTTTTTNNNATTNNNIIIMVIEIRRTSNSRGNSNTNKDLHTRNQHLRTHRGFSVALSNGLSVAFSNISELFSYILQK